MQILFIHGAGGWEEDQALADELRDRLGVPVSVPRFPDDDMSAATWCREVDRHRAALEPDLVMVGHSFGASMALLQLTVSPPENPPLGLALLAMPHWSTDGWQAEYALPADAEMPSGFPIWLHHCRDDEVVPIGHLDHHLPRLPEAIVRRYDTGGHQFVGRLAAVADDLAALAI